MTTAGQGDELSLLIDFSEAIASQRAALASRNWDELQTSIHALQSAMHRIADYPGGAEGLRKTLSTSEGQFREAADQLIEKVMTERRSSAELIRLQLQRLQALQAITSIDQDASTYGDSAKLNGRGARLSTWV